MGIYKEMKVLNELITLINNIKNEFFFNANYGKLKFVSIFFYMI